MKKHLPNEDLNILRNEKSDLCISIICPTHRLATDRKTDQLQLEKCIRMTSERLSGKCDEATAIILMKDMHELYDQIDYSHNAAGIGLFISAHVKKIVHYFSPVKESITIDRVFNLREILYDEGYNVPYALLVLSTKEVRLFTGTFDRITAITDPVFPKKYVADYEYSTPSRGNSYVGESVLQGFEKDKTTLNEIRLNSFYREIAGSLKPYVQPDTPILVAGDHKDLSSFRQVAGNHLQIAAEITGNYMHYHLHDLQLLAWTSMKQYLDTRKDAIIQDAKEKMNTTAVVTGGLNIWRSVMDGDGYRLLVEKDLFIPRFFADNNAASPSPIQLDQIIPDVVNLLIFLVLKKAGEVIIMENGSLEAFKGLALITHYEKSSHNH